MIIEVSGADIENIQLDGKPLTDLLMAPTRIYVKPLLKLIKEGTVKVSIVGALLDNILLNVSLSVQDTGVGISSVDQQRLFRPFAQVKRNVQHTEGTGLGLVICRSLLTRLYAARGVQSEAELDKSLARLIRGLVALLLARVNGLSTEELQQVDLPEPEGPHSTMRSPSRTFRSMPLST